MADPNLQDSNITSEYSPNSAHFETEFSTYLEPRGAVDSHNGHLLKIIFEEIYNDWEKHRTICCLTQPQFAKHLLSIHEKYCEAFVYNSTNSTIQATVPETQSQDFQEFCGILPTTSDIVRTERSSEDVKQLGSYAATSEITTICLPDWQSTSTLINQKQMVNENQCANDNLDINQPAHVVDMNNAVLKVKTTSAMCQTSDNEEDVENTANMFDIEADNKRFIKLMSKRNKKHHANDVDVAGRVKRKYVRKIPVPPKKVIEVEICFTFI